LVDGHTLACWLFTKRSEYSSWPAAERTVKDFKPPKWDAPFTLEVTFMSPEHADRGRETLKGERIGERTVRVTGDAVPDVLQCFERGFK